MKKILMLGTGGTIASEITESGLSPQLTTEQILHYCPDIPALQCGLLAVVQSG